MKIDVSRALTDFNGDDLKADLRNSVLVELLNETINKVQNEADRAAILKKAEGFMKPLTLRAVMHQAIGAGLDGFSAEERLKLFQIAVKLPKEGECDLESEEIALVKRAISKVYVSPMISGQCAMLLEGKDPFAPPKIEEKKAEEGA